MKKIILVLAVICLFSISVFANNNFNTSYISLGPSIYYFEYVERDDYNVFLDSEKGIIVGGNLRFQYESKKYVFIKLNIELARFKTTYDGFLQDMYGNKIAPIQSEGINTFFRGEFNFGYAFYFKDKFRVSPYIGLGYRYWLRGNSGDPGDYREDYSWFYFPLGIILQYKLSDRISLGLDLSVRFMFSGKLIVKISDILGPGYPDSNLSLGNKILFRVELPVEFYLSKIFGFSIILWYNYSAIGKSNVDYYYGIYEPKSTTHQAGINVNFNIYFGNRTSN